jgi:hypothetical protein
VIKKIEYLGLTGCLEVSNGDASLVIPTGFGPRVLFYGLDGGENVFGWHPDAAVETELGTWKPYGGHRLWVAPENMPLSYAPDNDPVEYGLDGDLSVRLIQPADSRVVYTKEMTVSLDAAGSGVTVDHKITDQSGDAMKISAWALTIMRPGGVVVIPNEPFAPYGPDSLLPVRSLAKWSYTDLTDPRWSFDKDAMRLKVDQNIHSQQKIGVLNRLGWVAYLLGDVVFTKRSAFIAEAVYPDMNSNFEVYTDGGFVEIESLSPLRHLEPGQSVEHQERWVLSLKGTEEIASGESRRPEEQNQLSL